MNQNEDSKQRRSLISSIFSPPPMEETKARDEVSTDPMEKEPTIGENSREKADVVRFSDPKPAVPPPLKIEIEESDQNALARWMVRKFPPFLNLSTG